MNPKFSLVPMLRVGMPSGRFASRTKSGREASVLHSHAKRGNEVSGNFF
ncbi:hypothetical protein [Desulfonema magnum]|uniref:Uncharacterized protein n=1 Tax=Desulfonema magnum TaxID=45655 RepID=A0A975BWW0_9BACT|nr:hypothetical protein [Desulfonema magnum]QTA93260.1 Uncharacterized protein dnm_093610 [Desulfonema magnum]